MFMRKGTKRKAGASWKGSKGGFKKRKGFGSGGGIRAISSPFGPSSVQFGAGKGITDQAVLYKTVGVPGRIALKLRTSYSGTLTSTSGAFTTGGIAIPNSCFDPAGAQGSIRAGGFTSWMGTTPTSTDGLYMYYAVTAFKLRLWIQGTTSTTISTNVGIRFLDASAQAAASSSDFMAGPLSRQTVVAQVSTGYGNQKVLSLYATTAQVASDVMASVAFDNTYAALSNANPASQCNADYFIQSTDASTTTAVQYRAELTQWVVLFGRKTLLT